MARFVELRRQEGEGRFWINVERVAWVADYSEGRMRIHFDKESYVTTPAGAAEVVALLNRAAGSPSG